jgi:hypothetical protein
MCNPKYVTKYGHWFSNLEMPEDCLGFVYIINCSANGKYYIGKKMILRNKKLKPLKGRVNKRNKQVESDWKSYTGSCKELNEDIEKYGKENFTFSILRFCQSKWELAYYEAKEQFERNVLFDDQSYNGILNLRIGKAPKGVK